MIAKAADGDLLLSLRGPLFSATPQACRPIRLLLRCIRRPSAFLSLGLTPSQITTRVSGPVLHLSTSVCRTAGMLCAIAFMFFGLSSALAAGHGRTF